MGCITCRFNVKSFSVDSINIGLILVAWLLAYCVPWPLLILAYAVLGPAHYLTQISWLYDRQFFTRRRTDYVYLILLSLGILLSAQGFAQLLLLTLFAAFAFAFFSDWTRRFWVLLLGVGCSLCLVHCKTAVLLLGFVPTLIHVYVLTALFMLNGAMKTKSPLGYIAVALLLGGGFSFFNDLLSLTSLTNSTILHEQGAYFRGLVTDTLQFFQWPDNDLYVLQWIRFIAFAYFYHYLNWFSKTRIIQWHSISPRRAALLVTLYVLSLSLYAYNYSLGFIALLFLSFAHVVLEFPLDFLMIKTNWQLCTRSRQ